MMGGKDAWRAPSPTTMTAVGCSSIVLSTGTIIINVTRTVIISSDHPATFAPFCPDGLLPIQIYNGPSILEFVHQQVNTSLLIFTDWQSPFYMSMVPACISVGGATAVIWTLCLALLCSARRPWVLKTMAIVAGICMVILSAVFFHYLRVQYEGGYVDGFLLVQSLDDSVLQSVVVMICNLALLIAEVLTLVRIFPRKRESRMILYTGVLVICIDKVLWGFSMFSPNAPEERTDPVDALLVFWYLFSIATAIVYACAIMIFSWWKWRIAYRWSILPLAILSHISTFMPIVLFLLDLADQYLESWSTYARLVSLMCASVCVWVWVDRIEDYERGLEQHSVLGRQQYTEDQSPFYLCQPEETDLSSGFDERGGVRDESTDEDSEDPKVGFDNLKKPEVKASPFQHSGMWRLGDWLKFSIIKRPPTSSSTQTTYVIAGGDPRSATTNMNGSTSAGTELAAPEAAMTIHRYPFRRREQRGSE
jgi:hypothetical protein